MSPSCQAAAPILPNRRGRIQQAVRSVSSKPCVGCGGGSTFTTSHGVREDGAAGRTQQHRCCGRYAPVAADGRCLAERRLSQPRSGREPHLIDSIGFLQKTRSPDPLSTCSYGTCKDVVGRQRCGDWQRRSWDAQGIADGGADPGLRAKGWSPARLVEQRLVVAAMGTPSQGTDRRRGG
jgi:hypothetical protein